MKIEIMSVADIERHIKPLTVKEKQVLYDFLAQELEHTRQISNASNLKEKEKRVFRAPVKRCLTLIFLTLAACACVLCLVAGYFAFLEFWYGGQDAERRSEQKLALIAIMASIEPGDAQDKVRKIFEQEYVAGLYFHRNETDLWGFYATHGIMDGTNTDWMLYIEFNDNGQVNALVMRTHEGPYRAAGGPHDKGRPVKYPFLLDVFN